MTRDFNRQSHIFSIWLNVSKKQIDNQLIPGIIHAI